MQEQANPYAPPKAVVSDAVAGEGVDPASRGSRLGAALLDSLVAFVIVLPLAISAGISFAQAGLSQGASAASMLSAASFGGAALTTFVLSVAWIIYTIVLVSRNGQTIGKKLVGIKVVRSDGAKATLGRIFWMRNVVNLLPSMIPFVGSVYGLVDALFIFNEKRQCLHDKIADTIVILA